MLETIDLSGLNQLKEVDLNNNRLTSVVAKDLPSLLCLTACNNKLTSIRLGQTPKLSWLQLTNNSLTEIDFPQKQSLTELKLVEGPLNHCYIDAQNLNGITALNLSHLGLTAIDATKLPSCIKMI